MNTHTHMDSMFSITYVFACLQINYTMSDWNPITVLFATVMNRCENVWMRCVEWFYLQMAESENESERKREEDDFA